MDDIIRSLTVDCFSKWSRYWWPPSDAGTMQASLYKESDVLVEAFPEKPFTNYTCCGLQSTVPRHSKVSHNADFHLQYFCAMWNPNPLVGGMPESLIAIQVKWLVWTWLTILNTSNSSGRGHSKSLLSIGDNS